MNAHKITPLYQYFRLKTVFLQNNILSSYWLLILNVIAMKTRNEYIDILKTCGNVLRTRFGVSSLRLFGSVARNEQTENSDIDVCVEMKPNLFQRIQLKQYLEEQLGCHVDVIRIHKNMNELLKSQIEEDGIYIFS